MQPDLMKYEKQIPIQYLRHYSEFDLVFLWKGRLSHRKFHELVQNHLSPDKFWFVLDSTMTTSKGESAQAQKKHKFIRIDRSQILKLVKRKFSALLNVPRNLFFFSLMFPIHVSGQSCNFTIPHSISLYVFVLI